MTRSASFSRDTGSSALGLVHWRTSSYQNRVGEGDEGMNSFESLRAEMVVEVRNYRRAWRLTMVPQLLGVATIALMLSAIAGYGLYLSVTAITGGGDVTSLAKAAQVFVGGGSSVLGFVVITLLTKLGELTRSYMAEVKRFTGCVGKLQLAGSRAALTEVLEDYSKRDETPVRQNASG